MKNITTILFCSAFLFGCDSAEPAPETYRDGEICYQVCVPDGGSSDSTGSGTDSGSGDETSSNPPPNDPCCFPWDQDRCMPGGSLEVQECVGNLKPACVGPDPQDLPWGEPCIQAAYEHCGLVCV